MDTRTEIKTGKSPRAQRARCQLLTGTFGTEQHDDQVRWWLQDAGLVAGRGSAREANTLTPEGLALAAELRAQDRKDRFGF